MIATRLLPQHQRVQAESTSMTLNIEHEALLATIAEMLTSGLERDGWTPTAVVASDLRPEYRKLFAMERARNIVAAIRNEQELAMEGV